MTQFIDMHCDTLTQANLHFRHDLYTLPMEQLDVKRLMEGGALAQFFAVCLPKITTVQRLGRLYEGDWKHIKRLAGILYHTCVLHGDSVSMCRSRKELDDNMSAGRISAVLTIEDGRDIGGSMERLGLYHRLGVRLITLTWNFANCFGYPNLPGGAAPSSSDMERGLTDFGKEAVGEMNRLGILIDVSHLSDGGFRDVAELSKKPFVASHSNCRQLCDHPRNLTDEMIRAVGMSGGVVGLNQNPPFLRRGSKISGLEDCVRHLRHLCDVGGVGCAALGSDFDGCGRSVRMGVRGPEGYQELEGLMLRSGFMPEEIDKIFYKNAERVLRDTLS